jgi:hypothetical protein
MIMSVEQLVIRELSGETEDLGENMRQCRFALHKCQLAWPGLEAGSPPWEAND